MHALRTQPSPVRAFPCFENARDALVHPEEDTGQQFCE